MLGKNYSKMFVSATYGQLPLVLICNIRDMGHTFVELMNLGNIDLDIIKPYIKAA